MILRPMCMAWVWQGVRTRGGSRFGVGEACATWGIAPLSTALC